MGVLFSIIPLGSLIKYGLMALAIVGAYWAWHEKIFKDGREYERGLIAARDERAISNARELNSTYDTCVSAHGVENWDRLKQRCRL